MKLTRILILSLLTFLLTIATFFLPHAANLVWSTSLLAQNHSESQALTIYEPIQNIEWEGMFVSPQGVAYFSSEQVSPYGLLTTDSDVQFARANNDRSKEAYALFKLGLANHIIGGFFNKAIEYYQQSLVIAKEIKDNYLEIMLVGNLGLAYLQNGFYYIEPFEYLEQYLGFTWHKAYYYNGGDPRLGGIAMGNLGNAYYSADLYNKAIEYHQKRLALSQEIKDLRGEGKALGDLGIVYHALGEYEQAIEYQQKRLAIAREIKDIVGEAQALSNLGIVYHTLGKHHKAIEYQEQYLAISKTIKNPLWEEQALGNLGGAYYFLGDYKKAIELYEKSLAIAWKIRESQIANKLRGNLGLLYFQMKNYPKAKELYNQVYSSASYTNNYKQQAIAQNNLAVVKAISGDLSAATDNLLKAIQVLESLRGRLAGNDAYKISIFETQTFPYINLQKFLIAQNKNDTALEISERGRARAFVELLSTKLSSKPKEQSTINSLKIDQIKQIAKEQNSTIVEYSIVSEHFKTEEQQQNQKIEILIWVIKPTGEIICRRSNIKSLWQKQNTSLEELITSSRKAIGVRGIPIVSMPFKFRNRKQQQENLKQHLQQLYAILIAPIVDLLPNQTTNNVIFIPHNELFLVPFAALQDDQGNYLIEKYSVLTIPSIQVLDLTHQRAQLISKNIFDILLVGNPTMPSVSPAFGKPPQQLPSLPGAETEIKAIANILNTKAILGNQATKSTILQLLPKAKIVHFATHGLLDEVHGLGSAIALTPAGKDNGLLTAEQIFDLKINAQLVILSACNTGRGRITGDGVIGLSRSFMSAGTPSVIVSLWSIPDAPTASLMTEFYQNTQKNIDKAEALRQAMLTIMKKYPSPKDWAAFTLMGER